MLHAAEKYHYKLLALQSRIVESENKSTVTLEDVESEWGLLEYKESLQNYAKSAKWFWEFWNDFQQVMELQSEKYLRGLDMEISS